MVRLVAPLPTFRKDLNLAYFYGLSDEKYVTVIRKGV